MKKVILKEDYEGMFEGSVVYVESETKNFYKGIWTSMYGTYPVKVPKKICKRYMKPKWERTVDKVLKTKFKNAK